MIAAVPRCPTCNSPDPDIHYATPICSDPFHDRRPSLFDDEGHVRGGIRDPGPGVRAFAEHVESELRADELERMRAADEFVSAAVEAGALARRSDPETSKAAARALSGKAGTMRARLLVAIARSSGPLARGLTAEQAATEAGYGPADGAWKRVSDLIRAGLVEPLPGLTRTASSGREQRVLIATREGLDVAAGTIANGG